MATETNKVVIDIEANSKGVKEASMSLADLKKELKAAQSAALNGDGKAAKRVAELKDKMDDLKDSTKSLQGSGVERIGSSFGLLGQGLKDFDFDKIKTGFKGVGAAMAAVPIFLLVEGITYLISNWKELSEGTGVVAKVLQSVTWVFTKLTEEIYAMTDAIGLTNSTLDKFGDSIKTNADKGKEALSQQTAEFDRQMKVAQAAGKSTVEIEQAKQQAIIDTNLAVARQIEAFVRAGGELDKEKRQLLTASLESIKNAKVEEYVIEQKQSTKLNEEYKKRSAEKKAAMDADFNAAIEQQVKEEAFRTAENEKAKQAEIKLAADRAKSLEDLKQLQLQADKDLVASNIAKWDEEAKARDKAFADEQAQRQESLNNASNATQSLQGLSDTVFAIKMAGLKKGSAEEEKAAKNQFKINKALAIASATLNGANSILAITAVPDFTLGVASALRIAAQIGTTAAVIAKISASQFQSSGGGDTSAPSIPSANVSSASPTTQAPTTQAQPFTKLDENGRNQSMPVIKAYVVENEMTQSQGRVKRLEGQASFG